MISPTWRIKKETHEQFYKSFLSVDANFQHIKKNGIQIL